MRQKNLVGLAIAALMPLAGAAATGLVQDGKTPVDKPAAKKEDGEKKQVDPEKVASVWEYLAGMYDSNGDGNIDKTEYTRGSERFARLDKDKSGFIEEADTQQSGGRGARGRRGNRGERGQRTRTEAPSEGAVAPNFKLESLYPTKAAVESKGGIKKGDAEEKGDADKKGAKQKPAPKYDVIELSSFKGKKPVALIFGSYT